MTAAAAQGLATALGLGRRELVSVVGAGGKTTAMYRLLEEGRATGWRVAGGTTTKIRRPPPPFVLCLAEGSHRGCGEAVIPAAEGIPILADRVREDGKVVGLPAARFDDLFAAGAVDWLVLEADGARERPLKAPAPWEPVVPTGTSCLVAVAGMSCVGMPLDGATVFRAEAVAALTGRVPGAEITAAVLVDLLTDPRQLCPPWPQQARGVLLLNQCDRCPAGVAETVAREVLTRKAGWERVVTGAAADRRKEFTIWRL